MNTKPIPIIITLLAAGITCLVSAIQRVPFAIYTKRLFIAVVCFALIGTVIKIVLDRSFPVMEEENEQNEEDDEQIDETAEEETERVETGEEQE
ncbi:MAG: hypothetical protein UEY91_08420 [Lachnospiraceae bacterium]|jgi:hypothetical protein|nr:hypothetical protein [Pseudobutyrivibrio sp.]MEE0106798.1 hypothetical protein [Lachnospiraceae bacterium]